MELPNTTRIWLKLTRPIADFALVPAGSFEMGDSLGDGTAEGNADELPVHTVYVSAFYMGKTVVTVAQWNEVQTWARNHGYTDLNSGGGRGDNYPVTYKLWYSCVKWCNALSERYGLTPVYRAGDGVFRTGESIPVINYSANGYRLPTEAEWEKAARGGLRGQRFPWGNTISHVQANYCSKSSYTYDINQAEGYNPSFVTDDFPYTNPVTYFAPNGYGLYDMAGNVFQWCGDWYGGYSSASSTDPTGPDSGDTRVVRGGRWNCYANFSRVSHRFHDTPAYNPDYTPWLYDGFGFRLARNSE